MPSYNTSGENINSFIDVYDITNIYVFGVIDGNKELIDFFNRLFYKTGDKHFFRLSLFTPLEKRVFESINSGKDNLGKYVNAVSRFVNGVFRTYMPYLKNYLLNITYDRDVKEPEIVRILEKGGNLLDTQNRVFINLLTEMCGHVGIDNIRINIRIDVEEEVIFNVLPNYTGGITLNASNINAFKEGYKLLSTLLILERLTSLKYSSLKREEYEVLLRFYKNVIADIVA